MDAIRLSKLCEGLLAVTADQDCLIRHLSLDSRQITPETLFFAIPGTHSDGRDYIEQALNQGVAAILCEAENDNNILANPRVFKVLGLNALIGVIAERFFDSPSSHLKMIGVTGTNGKTSCSHFIATALNQANISCAVMGTAGNGFPGRLVDSLLTTPDAISLHQTLKNFLSAGAKACAMEVSSHALEQKRTIGIKFDYAVFTNLTQDHLDYHGTMEKYGQAKRKLFEMPLKAAVINADDSFGLKLIKDFKNCYPIIAYSQKKDFKNSQISLISASQFLATPSGFSAQIDTPWGSGLLNSSLTGQFNLSNLLAALGVLLQFEIPFFKALSLLAELRRVVGRMETFGGGDLPLVVVDYAHTPDALEKALGALKHHATGHVWCLFGCGGERDKTKRPLMGKIAEDLSDFVVLTNDNPRHEEPSRILEDIQQGFLKKGALCVEPDREKAIRWVIDCAQKGDVILIAGKGHERTQQVGDHKYDFVDQVIAADALKKKGGI